MHKEIMHKKSFTDTRKKDAYRSMLPRIMKMRHAHARLLASKPYVDWFVNRLVFVLRSVVTYIVTKSL